MQVKASWTLVESTLTHGQQQQQNKNWATQDYDTIMTSTIDPAKTYLRWAVLNASFQINLEQTQLLQTS